MQDFSLLREDKACEHRAARMHSCQLKSLLCFLFLTLSLLRDWSASCTLMQELLYKHTGSDDPADRPDTAHVALVFERADADQAAEQGTLKFTRAIVGSGEHDKRTYSSQYHIDGRRVTMDDFTNQLRQLGINTKARNFLVFQVHPISCARFVLV